MSKVRNKDWKGKRGSFEVCWKNWLSLRGKTWNLVRSLEFDERERMEYRWRVKVKRRTDQKIQRAIFDDLMINWRSWKAKLIKRKGILVINERDLRLDWQINERIKRERLRE